MNYCINHSYPLIISGDDLSMSHYVFILCTNIDFIFIYIYILDARLCMRLYTMRMCLHVVCGCMPLHAVIQFTILISLCQGFKSCKVAQVTSSFTTRLLTEGTAFPHMFQLVCSPLHQLLASSWLAPAKRCGSTLDIE